MPAAPFDRQPPRRILVSCPQRIGDVLLATPIARTLKRAWPQAALDFAVFKGTEGILEGNPDIARVLAFPPRTGWRGKLAQFTELWRRYDLSLAAIASDRARLYGWAGARWRVGYVAEGERGKTLLLNRWLEFDDRHTHTVASGLRLTGLLGIEPQYQVVPPAPPAEARAALPQRLGLPNGHAYAVLHPSPKFAYKMWHAEGWIALCRWLSRQGLRVLLSGGPDAEEKRYVDSIAREVDALNLAGALSLAEAAAVLTRASLYVGPDTAMTHIAAAVGAPTVALFGPSNPVKWGPWPKDWNRPESPWPWRGGGRHGNVLLLQGPGDCVPCLLEGCDRHQHSSSRCLQDISSAAVIEAAGIMLAG